MSITDDTTATFTDGTDNRGRPVQYADNHAPGRPDIVDNHGDLWVFVGFDHEGVARYACAYFVNRGETITDDAADTARTRMVADIRRGGNDIDGMTRTRDHVRGVWGPLTDRQRDAEQHAEQHAEQVAAIDTHDAPETAELRRQVRELTEQRDAAERSANVAREATERTRQAHERFREEVREEAMRVAEEQGWCDDGLNQTMRTLGLPEVMRKRRVRVILDVEVDTSDDDEAIRWAGSNYHCDDSDVTVLDVDVVRDSVRDPED